MSTKFVFLILPHIHILDLAGPDQALHEAIGFGAEFVIEYCTIEQAVSTTSGLPLGSLAHYTSIKLNKGDFLMIPGSAYDFMISKSFTAEKGLFEWIKIQYEQGANVCSICMGVFALAESGLLNGKNCTTHFKKTQALQERFPKIQVIENILFTHQDRIYTSAGIAAGIDLTLHIIEQLKGSYFAHQVARELVVYQRRKGNATQESEYLAFRNHIHAGIHAVQDHIIHHISEKMYLYNLAEIANMSERNFTRIFKRETGITVNDFITLIRKETAENLLKNPDLSRAEVANKVGLQSEKQLIRILS
ncbi:MAG: helix-turn-helix domain-containing protein [Cytophagales bacterium]|nr:MAG: helix-turn-helix domain-containing protein [Cytophagales bacterium]TAF60020.1 MAG: helix-turn-helix domain-containing protein [Cytophagales bacterium]